MPVNFGRFAKSLNAPEYRRSGYREIAALLHDRFV
jgi:hypothetical protein